MVQEDASKKGAADSPSTDASKQKGRSPAYPSIAVDEAIVIAQKVYAAERRFSAPPLAILKQAGFEGTKSGPAMRVLAALRKYGIFEAREGDPTYLHIAEAVRPLVLNPADLKKRNSLILDMVGKYDELSVAIDQYKDGLPDDDALRSYLILERKFTDVGASEFIVILRRNAELVKLASSSQNGAMDPTGTGSPTVNSGQGVLAPPPTPANVIPPPPMGDFVLRWNVGSGLVVELRASGDLTPDDWDLVGDYVAIAKKAAARRAKETNPAS